MHLFSERAASVAARRGRGVPRGAKGEVGQPEVKPAAETSGSACAL
jgi:hypothetical protein